MPSEFVKLRALRDFEPGQMRLTQVSRQPFVGIDLFGQGLGPAPLPFARAVF